MSARDAYTIDVRCPRCGRTGVAEVSEHERPSVYSGLGRRVDKVDTSRNSDFWGRDR